MIDMDRIVGFEWDEANSRKNITKHGVGQSEAEQIFFAAPLLIVTDEKHSGAEPRYHAMGRTSTDRLLHVTFTLRRDATMIRVISARDMSRKERSIYARQA
jgi:uncharacterized DUF497 family protein